MVLAGRGQTRNPHGALFANAMGVFQLGLLRALFGVLGPLSHVTLDEQMARGVSKSSHLRNTQAGGKN